MLLAAALSTASLNRGLVESSLPPSLAETVISRMRRVKILPRLASVAAFLCLMFAHLLWPAMMEIVDEDVGNYTRRCEQRARWRREQRARWRREQRARSRSRSEWGASARESAPPATRDLSHHE